MAAPTQPASPPLTLLTQQGSSVREHDPAQQEKIGKFFQDLLRYRPFIEMVVGSGKQEVTAISAQLAVGNKLFLHVKGNGASTPFLIGHATPQGFVALQGVDEKIFAATKFLLNPSAPNATPPDFASSAATTDTSNPPGTPSSTPAPVTTSPTAPTDAPVPAAPTDAVTTAPATRPAAPALHQQQTTERSA